MDVRRTDQAFAILLPWGTATPPPVGAGSAGARPAVGTERRRRGDDGVPCAVYARSVARHDTSEDPRRRIPRTDVVLAALADLADTVGPDALKQAVIDAQNAARSGELAPEDVVSAARSAVTGRPATSLTPLLNATGVVLHTNIGRAALSASAQQALLQAAGHVDVEFDVDSGKRSRRGAAMLAALRAAVPAADDALVVNNGAAALVLATTALAVAQGRPEVIMSRGEIVEIGDNFRLHELIASTGVTIVEVGTTNRTWPQDYSQAIGERTGLVLKIHPSNFTVEGFTHGVGIAELAATLQEVRRERGIAVPLLADIGSGLLRPDPLLPDEPDATTAIAAGADLVTASGDKLLGGPQAGLVLGRGDLVQAMRRFPLARAVRIDKLTIAALEATLTGEPAPTHAALHVDLAALRRRSESVAAALRSADVPAEVTDTLASVGGGGAPGVTLPSVAVALDEHLTAPLRRRGLIARTSGGRCLVDLRGVPADADDRVTDLVVSVARENSPA